VTSTGQGSQALRRVIAVTPDSNAKTTKVDLETQVAARPIFTGLTGLTFTTARFSALRSAAAFTLASRSSLATKAVGASFGSVGASGFLHLGDIGSVLGSILGRLTPPPPPEVGAFALRARAGIFGHNAPAYISLVKPDGKGGTAPIYPNDWDSSSWEIWKDTMKSPAGYYDDADVYLEHDFTGILDNSWVVLEQPGGRFTYYRVQSIVEASLTGFGISAKTTGLRLMTPDGNGLADNSTDKPSTFLVRKTALYGQSEQLQMADVPITDPVQGHTLDLNGVFDGLTVGQTIIVSGQRSDLTAAQASEAATIFDITLSSTGAFTTLTLASDLTYAYQRSTVTIYANVARATHGETVNEVLGSGDGSQANQSFTLKKPPLTYVSAATPTGGQSTLELRVNDILWSELPSLYALGPRSQNYIVRIDDSGAPTITFGDGTSGERLPTGQNNITATYRSGTGPDGEVQSGSLTMMQTQPLGVRAVINPIAASGAAAPEQLEDARANAPLKVLTLDRIVSLPDYEDFARAFAGIGKAQAVAIWNGETRLVYLTVAGANGDSVDSSSPLFKSLRAAIDVFRDPVQQVQLAGFTGLTFSLQAMVLVDPRFVIGDVIAAVKAALLDAFSFANRDFAQAVAGTEVVKVIQSVEGVVAANLQSLAIDSAASLLNFISRPLLLDLLPQLGVSQSVLTVSRAPSFQFIFRKPPVDTILAARAARWQNGAIQPAELLIINPSGITLQGQNP
jgi:predicted phage baseplate assembly protein